MQPLSSSQEAKRNDGVQLKRNMGLFSAVNVILAVMIGSGIFISPSSALMYSGSVGMTIIVWALCGVISLLGKQTFAKIFGTILPSIICFRCASLRWTRNGYTSIRLWICIFYGFVRALAQILGSPTGLLVFIDHDFCCKTSRSCRRCTYFLCVHLSAHPWRFLYIGSGGWGTL